MKKYRKIAVLLVACLMSFGLLKAQTNGVSTYVNPIMGDHADQTLMRDGDDFYLAGSSFHYNPFIPIYHSTDLVHWEVIARLVPSNWAALSSDLPSDGTWQGALAKFGGYYWLYFSNHTGGGQYFCKATNMKGPWSAPTRVTGTGVTGYDNSVFVDDDGTPYLIMKNGAKINRILKLDKTTGHSTGVLLNLDWINAAGNYSMAEGPVMCKRNGRYYYFFAGDVYGGQWVISSPTLTATQSSWTSPQVFFTGTATLAGFNKPNHMSQPIKLDDGTWWCVAHAYGLNGWRGQGRICLLYEVKWNGETPYAAHASSSPVTAPNLPNASNIAFNFPREDYFGNGTLKLAWHFFNPANATKYSLTEKTGFMRLKPGTGTTHVLQKEVGRAYSLTTKMVLGSSPTTGQSAGLRIQNGDDLVQVRMYVGGGTKIGFSYNGSTTEINNTVGNTVYLRIDRDQHNIKGFYSADGKTWTQVGGTASVTVLDDYGTDYNSWVGNSIGLYATGITADFDYFKYRDASYAIPVAGYNNFNGVTASTTATNSTNGGWMALAGVSMGSDGVAATQVEVNAASASGAGSLELWIDNIGGAGTKIATIPITASGGATTFKNYTASVNVSGQHDLYFKFVGAANSFSVNTVKFTTDANPVLANITAPANNSTYTINTPITLTATASSAGSSITKVEFYNGTDLLGTSTASPYSISWKPTVAGTYSITAKATDASGKTGTSSAISVVVKAPQAPYGGTAWPIPGKIEFENFDEGGQDSAYNDLSAGSASASTFRLGTDVDIEACTDAGTGYNVGYFTAGEWMEYTVNVTAAGKYDLTLRVACNGDGRTVSISAKDVVIAKDVAIPNTAGWQTWQDVKVTGLQLSAGVQVIRVTMGATDYVNMNYMTFAAQTPPKQSVSLKKGWNLIGYPYLGSADVTTALSSIWPSVSVVKDIDSFYEKAGQAALNSLSKVSFGKGYYVKVSADCELTW